jgi:hypothetical protein
MPSSRAARISDRPMRYRWLMLTRPAARVSGDAGSSVATVRADGGQRAGERCTSRSVIVQRRSNRLLHRRRERCGSVRCRSGCRGACPTRPDASGIPQDRALRGQLAPGSIPRLVLGLIQVESGFRKYAVSSAGARGYMQVMPFWVKLIGSEGKQPVPPAHEPALRLHHPAPLPGHRKRQSLSVRWGVTTAAWASRSIRIWCVAHGNGNGAGAGKSP